MLPHQRFLPSPPLKTIPRNFPRASLFLPLMLSLGCLALGQSCSSVIGCLCRQLSTRPAPSSVARFFCSPQCSHAATSFALGHRASLPLAVDLISTSWRRWLLPSTMGVLCLLSCLIISDYEVDDFSLRNTWSWVIVPWAIGDCSVRNMCSHNQIFVLS